MNFKTQQLFLQIGFCFLFPKSFLYFHGHEIPPKGKLISSLSTECQHYTGSRLQQVKYTTLLITADVTGR